MSKRKPPNNLDGEGQVQTYFRACIMSNRVRLQFNSEGVLYARDSKQVRQLATWLLRASKYLEQEERAEKAFQKKWKLSRQKCIDD